MSIPALVRNETTKAAWVITVTTPNPSGPNVRVRSIWAANVARAAMPMPMMFCEVPERRFR
jgi:hypothetical protein